MRLDTFFSYFLSKKWSKTLKQTERKIFLTVMSRNIGRSDSSGVPSCPMAWMEDSGGRIGSPRHLLQAALLYVTVLAALWCVPVCLYHRISETGQAVVLTLVDTATAELQSLAEPKLTNEMRSRTSSKNSTLTTATTARTLPLVSSTTSTTSTSVTPQILNDVDDSAGQNVDELQSSDSPIILTTVESLNNSSNAELTTEDEISTSTTSTTTISSEEIGETDDEVVTVTAERRIVEDSSTTKTEEISEDDGRSEDAAGKLEENLGAAADLDEGVGRVRLVGGTVDEGAAVIIDGLVATGSTDHRQPHHHPQQHEDIPSFSEWAQKRLEEAEKKKTHPNASIQNPGNPGRGAGGMRVRSKNYASPDCGAKIVAVNPEARSARSVLVSTRDEYMLNTCTSRVWFVVELCEAIQAKKIELANFELFSSSPKDFSVHVSDRFPTRDWSPVGQFTAKDQRDVQSFALNPNLFGKFIKIEMQTHYGSEHFCPISLFRAYGTSEFEVLETETDHQNDENSENDDDDDDEDDSTNSETNNDSKNLFGTARDAVIRIVKKAAEVLVKTTDNDDKNNVTQSLNREKMIARSFENCTTLRYTVECPNCGDERFSRVFELLNCHGNRLDAILKISFVNETLRNSEICPVHGIDVAKSSIAQESAQFSSRIFATRFVAAILSTDHLIAICNVVATSNKKFALNANRETVANSSVDLSFKMDAISGKNDLTDFQGRPVTSICPTDAFSGNCAASSSVDDGKIIVTTNRETETIVVVPTETTSVKSSNLASQIKPTKTLSREDVKKESSMPILEPSKDPNDETVQMEVVTTPSAILLNVPTVVTRIDEESVNSVSSGDGIQPISTVVNVATLGNRETQEGATKMNQEGANDAPASVLRPENGEQDGRPGKLDRGEEEAKLMAQEQISLDSILSDLKDLDGGDVGTGGGGGIHGAGGHNSNFGNQPMASNTPQQKESVFLRLSNRIKALERNMSLSGQYLEELSKRYKKQVEEMQRSLERATAAMTEESRKGEERETRRLDEINHLRDEINSLTRSLEILLYDRDSWRGKLSTICQHFVLIVVEIVILIIVVSYCRRGDNEFDDVTEANRIPIDDAEANRRRSAGAMSTSPKKIRKRRPSEIASKITGNYGHLMIDDDRESKKERKKRKKRESMGEETENVMENDSRMDEGMPGGTTLSSRRSSSIVQASNHAKQLEINRARKRPDSAPEYSGNWTKFGEIDYKDCRTVEETMKNDFKDVETIVVEENREKVDRKNLVGAQQFFITGGGILKAAKFSSPSFMKTALGSRNKRNAKLGNEKNDQGAQLRSDNWEWYSKNSGNRIAETGGGKNEVGRETREGSNGDGTTNGHRRNPSDESGSSSATNTPGNKKEKKSAGGIRKMVRKLF